VAISQLIFKEKNLISTIELDVIIVESATSTVRLTQNPVENGADINDHIIVEPLTFTVEGVVSNVSSTFVDAFASAPTVFSRSTSKAQDAWTELLKLQAEKTPFDLKQGLKTYDNVVILTLSQAQDKDTANGLFFTSTMKQLILVGAGAVTADDFPNQNISDQMIPATTGGLKQLEE
jgi:hypothetical protein